jgi:peptide/nickel transport system substrate-binding protein
MTLGDDDRHREEPTSGEARSIDRRKLLARSAAVGVGLAVAGPLTPASAARAITRLISAPRRGGTLIEGYDRDFSPITTITTAWLDPPHEALLEPLVRPDPRGIETPVLAERWTTNADRTLWRFKIRDGLKFHSGAPCTAASVVADFKAFAAPDAGLPFWWHRVSKVIAKPGNVVEVHCNQTYGPIQQVLLQQEESNIMNLATVKKAGKDYGVTVVDGTGPFQLKSFVPNSHVEVTRWDGYAGSISPWFSNKGKAYLDGIRWVAIVEAANRANEILSRNVNAVKRPLFQDLGALQDDKDLVVIETQEPSALIFGLVHTHTELGFDDLRVRQAISHAVDRNALVKIALLGHGSPTYGPIPPSSPVYEKGVEKFNQFDTKLAGQLLDQAGWVMGSDGVRAKGGNKLEFTVLNWTDDTRNVVAQALTQMLKNVGINMSVSNLDPAAFFPALGKAQAFLFQWLWSYPIAQQNTLADSRFRPIPNWAMANIPAVDHAFDAWFSSTTNPQLTRNAKKIQLVMAQQLPFLTLYAPNVIWAHTTKVHGWQPTTTNLYPYYNDVWVEA